MTTNPFQVITVTEARRRLGEAWQGPAGEPETVSLLECPGRILARPVVARADLPGFARSTVDGYAVQAAGTFGASESLPAYLRLRGEVRMGERPAGSLAPGEAWRIATGAMLPPGADSVAMLEYCEELPDGSVGVSRPLAPGENVILAGEDARAGETVFPAGRRLRAPDAGLLAALGVPRVEVWPRVRVGIISSGNELVAPEDEPDAGQVRDVNSYALGARVREAGGIPRLYGIIPDSAAPLRAAASRALAENDLVLLSGGSSVGSRDLTRQVLEELADGEILFHGLALSPGKPALAAAAEGKLLLGLPGHPVSALVVFDLLAAPLLSGGYGEGPTPTVRAVLTRNVASRPGREEHVRVRLLSAAGGWEAVPVLGKSGLISTLAHADGEFVIPLEREGQPAGSTVEVRLY